jgi:hypothetical protein
MTPNKVVVRFQDGHVLKGFTADFLPNRDHFHVSRLDAPQNEKPVSVQAGELKAVFFVKDFQGDAQYNDRKEFDPGHRAMGRKIQVRFKDGEVLLGTTQGYDRTRPGFFLVPADPRSNIERCYVVTAATRDVEFV